MNPNISVGGSGGLDIGLLAAGLIFAYGAWVGRRDLGQRAALGVLGAMLLGLLPSLLPFLTVFRSGGWWFFAAVPVVWILSLALAFVPVLVAVNWLEVIRSAIRAADTTP